MAFDLRAPETKADEAVPVTGSTRSLLVFGINYAPEPTGIGVITTWLTRGLAERGWDVTMVTGMPHYPDWRRQSAPRRFRNADVAVRRHLHYVPARQSALRRAGYELTWTATAAQSLLARRSPDLVLGIVPSLGGGVLARLAASRYRVPYALLVQDVMGRAAEQSGVPGSRRVAGLVEKIETAIARDAEGIGVVADGFTDYFREAGVPSARIYRVRNPASLGTPTKPRDAVREQLGWKTDEFVVLHSGSMGYKQGLESVLEAAAVACDDRGLRFVLQGEGNQKGALEEQANQHGLRNVSFLPLASAEELPNVLRAADALLLSQRQSVRNMSLPSKLTSYFLAGVPTVAAVAPDDEVAREIESAGAGVVLEAGNPSRLVEVLTELRSDPQRAHKLGASARAFALQHLSAASAIDGFELLLRSCLDGIQAGGPWEENVLSRAASGTDGRADSALGRLIVSLMNSVPAPVARRLSTRSSASRILRPIVNRAVPSGPVTVTVRSGPAKGLALLVDLSKEKYYLTGSYEPRVQEVLATILRRGMTFWDVGAHVGFFTILGRQLVGSDGHVYAFEPIPENRERLLRASELNSFADIVVHADALSDRTGEASLEERGSTSTWTVAGDGRAPRCLAVHCTTLDEVAERLPAPDLVKIDVEGHELDVLRGGLNLFRNPRVSAIIEFHSPSLVVEARRLLRDHVLNQVDHGHWLMTHRHRE